MNEFPKIYKNISLYIFLSILLGIALGLFFGPRTESLIPLDKAVDMFLQTVILLYIPLSLLNGFGALQVKEADRLLFKAIAFLLLLWGIVIAAFFFITLFIPPTRTAVLDLSPKTTAIWSSLIQYLIPQNFFSDIAQNLFPPLAFFSLLLGVAFMHEKTKEPLLSLLQEGTYILEKILIWLVILSPFKTVIHFSVSAGTLDFQLLSPILYYTVIIIAICLFFSLFFLPMLVSILTPLSFRELFRRFAFVGLASFGTGQPLIAFPFIAEALRKIRLEYHFPIPDWRASYRLIVPLAFSFAQLGNMVALVFVFYFAYFVHADLGLLQKLILPFFSIILSIGSPLSSVENLKMLIEQLHFPPQANLYFQQIQPLTLNFKVLFSSTAALCLTIIVMMLHEKKLQKAGKKLFFLSVVSIIVFSGLLFAIRSFVPHGDVYDMFIKKKSLVESMRILPKMNILVYPEEAQRGHLKSPERGSVLSNILARGKLRAGFFSTPPYCYYNQFGELIGFDVAMVAELARELDVDLEFIPLNIMSLEEDLNSGLFDIAIGDIMMTSSRLLNISLSSFYQESNSVLITLRSNFENYLDLSEIQSIPGLRVGANGAMIPRAREHFPEAIIVEEAPWNDLFNRTIDVFFGDQTAATFLSLSNPNVITLNFGEVLGRIYVCYGMAKADPLWKEFIDGWLSLQKVSGFLHEQQEYWIHGEPKQNKSTRWNLLDTLRGL